MTRITLISAVGLLAFVFAGCHNWNWRESQVAETKKRGDAVRHALSEHNKKTGAFPASLDALVPQYLKEIPQPTVGQRKWNYKTYVDKTGYLLSVAVDSEREPELHATETGGWVYKQK